MLRIETEREDDRRWLAEALALPGVLSSALRSGHVGSRLL
jgi:hypothetical protein